MSDNPRPVLYGSGYEAFLPRAVDADRPRTVTVVGKHCESGDLLVRDAAVPADLAVGDVLATPVTGAYGHSHGLELQQGACARPWCSAGAATPASWSGARPTTTSSPPTWVESRSPVDLGASVRHVDRRRPVRGLERHSGAGRRCSTARRRAPHPGLPGVDG